MVDWYRLERPRAAVLICHGFFQHRRTPRFLGITRHFLQAGYDAVIFDFGGHGESGGWYTFGRREVHDCHAVLDLIRPHYPSLGVLSFSMGASTAIRALAQRRSADSLSADSLIAVSPVADPNYIHPWTIWWPGAFRTAWRQRKTRRGFRGRTLHYGKPRALDAAAGVSPVPVLFVHSVNDWLIQARHSRELFERANEPKALRLMQSDGHAEELFESDPDGFTRLCDAWFQDTLPRRPRGG